jgi:chromosome segregation ATPase
VTDLEGRFAEVERRVRAIARENAGLRRKISELEGELDRSRREATELGVLKEERGLLREKIERILRAFEPTGKEGGRAGPGGAS